MEGNTFFTASDAKIELVNVVNWIPILTEVFLLALTKYMINQNQDKQKCSFYISRALCAQNIKISLRPYCISTSELDLASNSIVN